jgi:ABC-type transport system involved in multi-copper enzyme maturation permease subunit
MPIILRWLLRQGPANPIAVRLVQNASRRAKHMYIRAAYLAVLIVVLLWALLSSTQESLAYQQLAQAGAGTFTQIAYLQILLICILAPVFMGGAIAQESSPRTWDILLTTPLTASEIVLGNLLGRLLFIFGLLFCSLPLFALTQYFGGVPGTAIIASYLIAACAALLVGALAIALAVSRLVGKRAFFAFYIAIVSYLGVTLAIDYWLVASGQGAVNGNGVTYMTALNPFLALKALLNPSTYPRATEGSQLGFFNRWMLERPITAFCAGSSLLSVFFMVASTFTVRSGGLQTLGTDESGLSWFERIFGPRSRNGETDSRHRAPRPVGVNPISWREASSRNSQPAKIAARWAFVGLGFLFAAGLIYAYHQGNLSHETFQFAIMATVWVELTVISLVAIMASATAISKEREDGTLDLLLTTPITASSYLTGKLRGLIAYLLPLLCVPWAPSPSQDSSSSSAALPVPAASKSVPRPSAARTSCSPSSSPRPASWPPSPPSPSWPSASWSACNGLSRARALWAPSSEPWASSAPSPASSASAAGTPAKVLPVSAPSSVPSAPHHSSPHSSPPPNASLIHSPVWAWGRPDSLLASAHASPRRSIPPSATASTPTWSAPST